MLIANATYVPAIWYTFCYAVFMPALLASGLLVVQDSCQLCWYGLSYSKECARGGV